MADIDLTVDRARLIAMGTSRAGPIFRHMAALGARIESKAKRNASGAIVKVRTGNLRASIHTDMSTGPASVKGVVEADAPYALAVHEGQKPHDIRPLTVRVGSGRNRRGGVLRWTGPGGQPRFATRVHHPGTHARPFLRDALYSEIR